MANEKLILQFQANDQATKKVQALRHQVNKLGGVDAVKTAKEMRKLNSQVKLLNERGKKVNGMFGKLTQRFAAGAIAATAVVAATSMITRELFSIVKIGMESEKVWNDVTASLERHGHAVNDTIPRVKQFADEMQTLSGISDEDVGTAFQRLLDSNIDLNSSFSLTQAAMDLSVAKGMDLVAAADMIGKSIDSDTNALSRYGIAIDKSLTKQQQMAQLLGEVNDRFGGAAAARMDTTAGKLALLGERYNDLKEELFKLGSPLIIGVIEALTVALKGLNIVFEALGVVLDAVGVLGKEFAGIVADMESPIYILTGTTSELVMQMNDLKRSTGEGKSELESFVEVLESGTSAGSRITQVLLNFSGAGGEYATVLKDINSSTKEANATSLTGPDWTSFVDASDQISDSMAKFDVVNNAWLESYRAFQQTKQAIKERAFSIELAGLNKFDVQRKIIARAYENLEQKLRESKLDSEELIQTKIVGLHQLKNIELQYLQEEENAYFLLKQQEAAEEAAAAHEAAARQTFAKWNWAFSAGRSFAHDFANTLISGNKSIVDSLKNLGKSILHSFIDIGIAALKQYIIQLIIAKKTQDALNMANPLSAGGGIFGTAVGLVKSFLPFDDPVNDANLRRESRRIANFMIAGLGQGFRQAMPRVATSNTNNATSVINNNTFQIFAGGNVDSNALLQMIEERVDNGFSFIDDNRRNIRG